jgi:hypothetical protein
MSDQFDMASDREQLDRDLALKVRLPTLKACGACYSCNTPLHAGLLFCDKDCAADWERVEAARRRNGT